MTADSPVTDDECDQLFSGLAPYRLLLLAVSGGADSTAMLHLIAHWARRQGDAAPRLHVVTVDHDLRQGSRAEAETVAHAAAAHGLPHHVLTWTGPKPQAGLQDAARTARYALLARLLRDLGEPAAALVTAHTADDQAETLLMRLARGSGIDGLSAMAPRRRLSAQDSYDLVRPLLGITKSRLLATLRAHAIAWTEDPSNTRLDFERVRIRAAAATLADLGLVPEKLALSARRLARVRTAVDAAATDFEARVLDLNHGAYAAMQRSDFTRAPDELRLRLLIRVLSRFGGAAPATRLSRIERLLQRLDGVGTLTATLGGCVVAATASHIRIFRESGRAPLPECRLDTAAKTIWDDRFAVSVAGLTSGDAPVIVKALGATGYATLRRHAEFHLPQRAATTLPSFWSGQTLLAVPSVAGASEIIQRPSAFTFYAEFLGLPDDVRISD